MNIRVTLTVERDNKICGNGVHILNFNPNIISEVIEIYRDILKNKLNSLDVSDRLSISSQILNLYTSNVNLPRISITKVDDATIVDMAIDKACKHMKKIVMQHYLYTTAVNESNMCADPFSNMIRIHGFGKFNPYTQVDPFSGRIIPVSPEDLLPKPNKPKSSISEEYLERFKSAFDDFVEKVNEIYDEYKKELEGDESGDEEDNVDYE